MIPGFGGGTITAVRVPEILRAHHPPRARIGHPVTPPETAEAALRTLPVPTTQFYFVSAARDAAGPAPTLIGLHGYGQTGEDFLGLMRKIAPPGFACAAGQGFNQLWDPRTKGITFSWLTSYEKRHRLDSIWAYLSGMIDRLAADGVTDPARVWLLGFSQGSSLAYRFAQLHPGRVRGVVSVCADLPPDVKADLGPLRDVPVLIAYGTHDNVIPPAKSTDAFDVLREGGVDVEIVSFERGHLIPSDLGPRLTDWTRRKG